MQIGDIIKTQNGEDVKKGNALEQSVAEIARESSIRERIRVKPKAPDLVIIGNIAYDVIDFSRINKKRENIVDIGGACTFSSIPASLYHRVGMVGKIGNDFDISKFYQYNIDLSRS